MFKCTNIKFIYNVIPKPNYLLRLLHSKHKNLQKITEANFRKKANTNVIGPFGWFLLIVPASTFALGTWQIQRKKWKEALIYELNERSHANPVPLPASIEELDQIEYYPVHVKGQFIHDKELFMGPRTLLEKGDSSTASSLMSAQNKSQGYLVVTPFKLADRDETILVNRGWIPSKQKDPQTRLKGQIEGVTDVIGVVRLHENRPNFMPANKEKAWFYRDLEQMSNVTGASPIYLDATKDFEVKDGPIGGQTRISLRNEHLSYVFTWYSLSFLTSFMWFKQFIKTR